MRSSTLTSLLVLVAGIRAAPATPELAERNTDINEFLAFIESQFSGIHDGIEGACDAITAGEQVLSSAFGVSTSSSASGDCADVTLVFARGTCDPGNLGALVAPPLIQELKSKLGGRSLAVQGVEYPASVEGYLSDDPAGGKTMASEIKKIQSSCPNTKLVMGGYSQGGYVVHNAANDLGSDVMSKVSAVVIFGDPDSAQDVNGIDQSRVKIICHQGDDICQQGDIILVQHLTYAENADAAASFIVSKL